MSEELIDYREVIENETPDDVKEAEAKAAILAKTLKYVSPTLGEVYVHHPTIKEDSEINEVYLDEFSRLANETNLPSMAKMERILAEKGNWTEEDDKKIDGLFTAIRNRQLERAQLRMKMKTMKRVPKKLLDQYETLSDKIQELELSLQTEVLRKSSMLEATLEKKAEKKALYHKLILCTKREDGTRVWETMEDFENETASDVRELIMKAMMFWQGVSTPLSEGLLEVLSGN